MNKIMTVQNPNTQETSCVLVGETLDTATMILSKPDMNRHLGWINCLHDEILDTEFTIVNPVLKDISKVESKYHTLWKEDNESYSLDAYMFEALCELKREIDLNFALSESVDELLGELDGVETPHTAFVDLTKYITNGRMIPTLEGVLIENQIDVLVFKFNITDYIGWETVGYCIYDLTLKSMKCYISPVSFFTALENKRYGYCGHVYAMECMTTRDVFDDKALKGIRGAIETRIVEFDDKAASDSRIEETFKL